MFKNKVLTINRKHIKITGTGAKRCICMHGGAFVNGNASINITQPNETKKASEKVIAGLEKLNFGKRKGNIKLSF